MAHAFIDATTFWLPRIQLLFGDRDLLPHLVLVNILHCLLAPFLDGLNRHELDISLSAAASFHRGDRNGEADAAKLFESSRSKAINRLLA